MTPLKTQAVHAALTGDWNTAIALNKAILKEEPNGIETLNRLALAFTVVGKIKDAKNAYQKVLAIDSQNPIAIKNVKRLSLRKVNGARSTQQAPFLGGDIGTMFLEENGKTKVVELIHVAEPKVVFHLMTGEFVTLHVKRLKIFVLDRKKQYIGMLPDDIGKRLIKFISGGNTYTAYIKSVMHHRIAIFIKEIKRVNRFKNQSSFTPLDKTKITIQTKSHSDKEDEELSEDSDDSSLVA